MKKQDKKYFIEKLNEILDSNASKLTKKDRDKLVVIREKISNCKTKKGLAKTLSGFLKFWNYF